MQIGTKKNPFFFSLPDIYHAKNRDKTGETESQKKGIFLAISLSVGRMAVFFFYRDIRFYRVFFRKSGLISIKKPGFFFTLSILPGFRKKRNRIFTMQKKKHWH